MSDRDGGPAFPPYFTRWEKNPAFDPEVGDVNQLVAVEHHGMSLRDYFAAQALVLLASNGGLKAIYDVAEKRGVSPAEGVASYVYEVADGMLKARQA